MFKLIARSPVLAIAVALGACAQSSAPRAPAPPVITEAEVAALTELMQLEDTRTFDATAFTRLNASASPLIRSRAALAAGRIGKREAAAALVGLLNDSVVEVRANAAFALGEIGDTATATIAALGARSVGQGADAVEAIAALGKIAGPTARPHVENALRTRTSGGELREALLAYWRFPRLPITSQLLVPHTKSVDPEIRWRAVYALVRGGADPANNANFRQWLSDTDPLTRSFAARGLSAARADSAGFRADSEARLLAALSDASPWVRINAVGVLAGYRNVEHAPSIAALRTDPDLNVRMAAIAALAALRAPAAAQPLAALVRDATQPAGIRGAALNSLMQLEIASGSALAWEMAQLPDPIVRKLAAGALGSARTTEARNSLYRLSSDSDRRVRVQAVSSVANLTGDTLTLARTFFIEKLADVDPYVRAAALNGLEQIAAAGDEAIVLEAFERALQDSTEESGVAAIGVLAKLAAANPAVQRSFQARFPLERITTEQVRRAAARRLKLDESCCKLEAQPDLYGRVTRDVLVPALRGAPLPRVRVTTAAGVFEMELFAADAPITVDNFLKLVRARYFDNGRWHRVVPNFVLQDGDPTGTGSGGPGYAIRDEMNRQRYLRGVLGMALSGPDTGGSQWFVTHTPQPHLDGGYTVFGRVVSGMEIADRVIQEDPIVSIQVIE